MAGRVIVVPDANGVIRVRCGDAIIEIEVGTSADLPGTTSASGPLIWPSDPPKPRDPADNPIVALRVSGAGQPASVTWVGRGASVIQVANQSVADDVDSLASLADQAHRTARATPGPDAPTIEVDADVFDVHLFDRLATSLQAGGDYTIVANLRGRPRTLALQSEPEPVS
jgi:hypothetical protein